MLRSLKDLEKYSVTAIDGDVGKVVNFLLDDERWAVRYLVAETGGFFEARRLLVSPISFRSVDWSNRHFHVSLTRDKVKSSPNVDTDKPVSRQHEEDYSLYYGYPPYWAYPGMWGFGGSPGALADFGKGPPPEHSKKPDDVHLRSVNELCGYHIQGQDGAIGHVEDFIVDDETWQVHYLVIDTSNWWFGKKVLIPPQWASSVSLGERKVHVDISREVVKNSPEWIANDPINRGYELCLYDYYGKPVYWAQPDSAGPRAQAAGRPPG